MPMPENQAEWDNMHIIFATAKGNIRRNDLSDFKKIQANGKIAIRMDEDDSLINVRFTISYFTFFTTTKS
jgi:DNA gyrase subunit A